MGPDGENAAHYRKAQLYYTDETWALEGNKGFYGDHITGLGQTAAGICECFSFLSASQAPRLTCCRHGYQVSTQALRL